jgi:ribosome maturation factor RimP
MPSAQRRTGARPAGKRQHGPASRDSGPTIDLAASRARLTALVDPLAVAAGYDLEDLAVVRMGRRFVVRITVDRDGGVPLDGVAELARSISSALDEADAAGGDVVPGEYQLEVSSPGTDRQLTLPRHWRRNVGRLVKVKAAGHTILGRVVAADDALVQVDVDGTVRDLGYDELGPGRVEIEFSRVDEIDEDDMVAFGDDEDVDADSDDDSDEDETKGDER